MNTYRKMLAKAIENNGGYSRGYHDRFAISYEVGLYYADTDIDHIAQVAAEHHGLDLKLFEVVRDQLDWDEDQHWRWAQGDMAEDLNDDYAHNTYGPDTASKFGLPYRAFPRKYKRQTDEMAYYPSTKAGWILVDPYINLDFDVKFGLYGRSGKHLCVESFEGIDLTQSSESLVEEILSEDTYYSSGYSNVWCRNLLAMMHEWEEMFTSKKASAELEWRLADQLTRAVEEYTQTTKFATQVWQQRQDLGVHP